MNFNDILTFTHVMDSHQNCSDGVLGLGLEDILGLGVEVTGLALAQ